MQLTKFTRTPVTFATAYADQADPAEGDTPTEFVIPEDTTGLTDAELASTLDQARDVFGAVYNGGNVAANDLDTLMALTEAIESLSAEQATRAAEAQERSDAAAALAARALPEQTLAETAPDAPAADGEDDEEDDEDATEENLAASDDSAPAEVPDDEPAELVAAARREVRVNLSGLTARQAPSIPRARSTSPSTIADVAMAAPDVPGFSNGEALDWDGMARAMNERLRTYNGAAYSQAAATGRAMRQQFGVAVIRKPYTAEQTIASNDPVEAEEVFARVTNERLLPGGSLVASGGWCSPSETLYDLYEVETRDGLFSLPEVNVARGGIKWAVSPSFAELYAQITGFHYTEAQDEAGQYGVDPATGIGNSTAGTKPCFKVDCPDWEEARLELDGLCIQGGLLQNRSYPEYTARIIRGALVAHDHRMAARRLATITAGSTAVAFAAGQVGTTAPLLTAIELQVEHYRSSHRPSRSMSLEAIFPFWVKGAIRADLSRRLGVDLLNVTDAQITGWFSMRGINPQFVYNLQDLTGDAAAAIAYPTEARFLLYAPGTWVGGTSDVLTLNALYDSTLLGENDYTALFTEEGVLVAKRGLDSRSVTVPICPDGATAAGVAIACNGTEVPAV